MEDIEHITQEISTLSTLDLLYLLDNIQAQILGILIERGEALENTPPQTH